MNLEAFTIALWSYVLFILTVLLFLRGHYVAGTLTFIFITILFFGFKH